MRGLSNIHLSVSDSRQNVQNKQKPVFDVSYVSLIISPDDRAFSLCFGSKSLQR